MKSFLFVALNFIVITFVSCDGRKTANQALSESIEEFLNTETIEFDFFLHETYVEREVDTIIINGYRVKIKTFID
mgnify:CR=1 FL=1